MVKRELGLPASILNNHIVVLGLIIVYPLLFIWQGLDFTDTGYILSNYQQIFIEPSSIEASFRIWLTDVLGGIWIYFFGDSLGLTGARFAAVLLVYATLYVSYLTLKPYLKRTYLLWGLFLALIFINQSGYWLNYNSFTAFFYVLGAYYLIGGLREQQPWRIFAAAFVLGLNIFIRLPNGLDIFLLLGIFFHGFTHKVSFSRQVKLACYFMLGYFASIIVVLSAMFLMGHLGAYITAFKGTFTMLKDPIGHHRGDRLIDTFIRHHKTMLEKLWSIGLALIALMILLSVTAKLKIRFLQYALILSGGLYFVYSHFTSFTDWVNMLIVTVGILYIVLAAMALWGKRVSGTGTVDLRLISFISLLVLFLAPLGSNVAIRNSIYGMYLGLPLAFGYLAEIKQVGIIGARDEYSASNGLFVGFRSDEAALIRALALVMFIFFTLQSTYYFTYRDTSDRLAMSHTVNHPRLKGVLTTSKRARVVDELLKVLPRYVKEGDYLLAYEQVSMVHFLTKTKPYMYSAWPMLYSTEAFKQALERAQRERPYLPVIVRAKGNTEDFEWPRKEQKLIQTIYYSQNRQEAEDFIRKHHYKLAWANSFFEILVPEERTPKQ